MKMVSMVSSKSFCNSVQASLIIFLKKWSMFPGDYFSYSETDLHPHRNWNLHNFNSFSMKDYFWPFAFIWQSVCRQKGSMGRERNMTRNKVPLPGVTLSLCDMCLHHWAIRGPRDFMLNNNSFVSTEEITVPIKIYQCDTAGTYAIVNWFGPFA